MMERLSWKQICRQGEHHGHWLALSDCRYDETTGHAVEGCVIDSDEELASLCNRLQEDERKNCAIVFCKGDEEDGLETRGLSGAQRCA